MRMPRPTRRRFLTILAATAVSAVGGSGRAMATTAGAPLLKWRGYLMGADVTLALGGVGERAATRLVRECSVEASRLERLFSLHLTGSAISRLNAAGSLIDPAPEFLTLLGQARAMSVRTHGAFDATVQPLWQLYRDHFAGSARTQGPSRAAVRAARQRVDYMQLSASPRRITFTRPGMALTLNGIAQGYITDRIAALFKARGLAHVLVDMGEHYALGPHPDGRPWRVAIRDPLRPTGLLMEVPLEQRALATSGGYGFQFDAAGRFHHLFDPATGDSARHHLSVTVASPSATVADGLATAFCAMPLDAVGAVVHSDPTLTAWLVGTDGELTILRGGG